MLFIKETNENIAIWEGHKFTKKAGYEISGIKSIHWLSEFEAVFNTLMAEADCVYVNANEHIRAIVQVETRDARFIKWCKKKYPTHHYERVAPLVHKLRAVKAL